MEAIRSSETVVHTRATLVTSQKTVFFKKLFVRFEVLTAVTVKNAVFWDIKTHARFEVFTAVNMKNGVFWDVTPRGSCKIRRFGGTLRIHHQSDKIVTANAVPISPILTPQ
jgi:hypothetical protein